MRLYQRDRAPFSCAINDKTAQFERVSHAPVPPGTGLAGFVTKQAFASPWTLARFGRHPRLKAGAIGWSREQLTLIAMGRASVQTYGQTHFPPMHPDQQPELWPLNPLTTDIYRSFLARRQTPNGPPLDSICRPVEIRLAPHLGKVGAGAAGPGGVSVGLR